MMPVYGYMKMAVVVIMVNYIDYYGSWKTRLFYRIFKKGVYGLKPERIYVNNLEMCKSVTNTKFILLPFITGETDWIDFLNNVFLENSKNDLQNKKYIYLFQPLEELLETSAYEDYNKILDHLKTNHKSQTIVRKHPREHDQDYRGLDVSLSNSMWELFCLSSLSDKQVLISLFSTAQITPKLLYGKEPRLIFLYHLVPTSLTNERIENIDKFVQDIREKYRDKSRISIPTTMHKFEEALF